MSNYYGMALSNVLVLLYHPNISQHMHEERTLSLSLRDLAGASLSIDGGLRKGTRRWHIPSLLGSLDVQWMFLR